MPCATPWGSSTSDVSPPGSQSPEPGPILQLPGASLAQTLPTSPVPHPVLTWDLELWLVSSWVNPSVYRDKLLTLPDPAAYVTSPRNHL